MRQTMRPILLMWMLLATLAWSGTGRAEEPEAPAANVEGPTFGGMQFWTDELIFHGWRIQRHTWTTHYRLLDDQDYRRAWGSFDHCRQRLEVFKQELKLPPLQGKVVVVLHGLIRSRQSMAGIGEYLQRHGEYTALNFSYASTRNELQQHADSLASVVAHLGPEVTEINFVAHSLGNLVIRHYLGDQTKLDQDQVPDPRIKRIVMLAPPNNGAAFARKFADNGIFQAIWGKSGGELANQWETLQPRLATPSSEFAIIAGGKGEAAGNNPLLAGDDDFVVSVEETRLPGAHDFIVVPALHGLIMDDPLVREYTLRFLWHGYLVSADERQPIPAAVAQRTTSNE